MQHAFLFPLVHRDILNYAMKLILNETDVDILNDIANRTSMNADAVLAFSRAAAGLYW
jgi:hypothetical protein